MISVTHGTTAPTAPGRLGQPLVAQDALRYLEALGAWRDARKAELDVIDEAALSAADEATYTQRPAALDGPVEGGSRPSRPPGGHVGLGAGRPHRARAARRPWSGGGSTPRRVPWRPPLPPDAPRPDRIPGRLAARGVPAVRRAGRLAAGPARDRRIGGGPAGTAPRPARLGRTGARPRRPRAGTAPRRRLVGARPARQPRRRRARQGEARGRRRGLLGPLEQDAARAERDLIVAASNRRADAHDEARARALRSELEARGAALRDLAARCVAQVAPAPRFAVPDVSALGPVPTDPAAVDAYLVRLDAVGRAMTMAQDAYASALSERDELRMTLGAYAAKATDRRAAGGSTQADADLVDLRRRAGEALDREPADLVRGRALLAAYIAYLSSTTRQPKHPRPDGGTP